MADREAPSVEQVAAALRVSVGLLVRRLRQAPTKGELTLPETSILARLERGGPATPTALARLEQISPQSVGATLGALEARGLVNRTRDPDDGRQIVMSLTETGQQELRERRDERVEYLAQALAAGFTRPELKQLVAVAPLLERLAQSI
jgi:DNA-binding MarR family transcriptional regulator